MSYEVFEAAYNSLTAEKQMIVYNLVISLKNLDSGRVEKTLQKRQFGKFRGKATAEFADDWEMREEELCAL